MSQPEGPYEFAGYKLDSPLINAAGSINGTNIGEMQQRIDELLRTGIGGITLGTFTIPRREGNEPKFGSPVFIIDEGQGKTWNSMGLPNIGSDEAVRISDDIADQVHDAGKILIYSGSATDNEAYGNSVEQSVRIAKNFLETQADLVELNVSCWNIVNDRGEHKSLMGYDLQTMRELISALKNEVGSDERLGVKLPPYLTDEQFDIVPDLAKLIRTTRVFRYLATCNTIPNQIPEDANGNKVPLSVPPEGAGGMSGPATQAVGRDQTALWYDQTHREIDINSAEGVDTGYELAVRKKIGAKVGSGVTFLWRSNNWQEATTKMLREYADELKVEAS